MTIGPAALVCFQAGVNDVGARFICPGIDEGWLWASSYLTGWNLSAFYFFYFYFFLHQYPKAFLEVCSMKTKAEISTVLPFDGLVFFKLQCFKRFSLDSFLALPVREKKMSIFLLNIKTV